MCSFCAENGTNYERTFECLLSQTLLLRSLNKLPLENDSRHIELRSDKQTFFEPFSASKHFFNHTNVLWFFFVYTYGCQCRFCCSIQLKGFAKFIVIELLLRSLIELTIQKDRMHLSQTLRRNVLLRFFVFASIIIIDESELYMTKSWKMHYRFGLGGVLLTYQEIRTSKSITDDCFDWSMFLKTCRICLLMVCRNSYRTAI